MLNVNSLTLHFLPWLNKNKGLKLNLTFRGV